MSYGNYNCYDIFGINIRMGRLLNGTFLLGKKVLFHNDDKILNLLKYIDTLHSRFINNIYYKEFYTIEK